MAHIPGKTPVFYRARKDNQVTRVYDTPGMARSMRTRTWGKWDGYKTVYDGAVVEYVKAEDWKLLPDGASGPPDVETSSKEKPKHTAVVSISDSITADPVMPLGHLIGQEIYNTLCTMYDQAQANDEVPGKLIIESEVNPQYRATDYHISLFTTKVE